MADEVTTPQKPDPLQASHEARKGFEQLAYNAVIAIILCAAVILLFGIVFPPPPPDTKLADWGAAIVARETQAVPVLLTLLCSLAGALGITLTRGAHDARLDKDCQ